MNRWALKIEFFYAHPLPKSPLQPSSSFLRYSETCLAIGPAPHRVSGPFGPGTPEESGKSPERVPGAGPQKCPKSAPRSLKRVRKESESQILDSFRTLSTLRGALFGHFWGPAPGYSFRTLSGLFWGFGPEGPGRPCVGRGRSQGKSSSPQTPQQDQGPWSRNSLGFVLTKTD